MDCPEYYITVAYKTCNRYVPQMYPQPRAHTTAALAYVQPYAAPTSKGVGMLVPTNSMEALMLQTH